MSDSSNELLNITGNKKTLEKLLLSQPPSIPTEIPPPEKRKTFKVDTNTDILSRVQSFLPQLQSANEQLKKVDPKQLDIENVEETEPYIEMNLGLGVYDVNKDSDTEEDIILPTHRTKEKPKIEIIDK